MRYGAVIEPHDCCPEWYLVVVIVGTVVAGVYRNAGSVIVYADEVPRLIGAARKLSVVDLSSGCRCSATALS